MLLIDAVCEGIGSVFIEFFQVFFEVEDLLSAQELIEVHAFPKKESIL